MNLKPFSDRVVVVFGGTGSLGSRLVRKIVDGSSGMPKRVIVVSRDEWKHWTMRKDNENVVTGDGRKYNDVVEFRPGDVRDPRTVNRAVMEADVVIQTAALKHVPVCEYAPREAVLTNILGSQNIVDAIRESSNNVQLAIAISTDKACEPVNVMGMTKALMERIFIEGNIGQKRCRFVCVRFGNIVSSRGLVVPLFKEQVERGGPVTITDPRMTRFLITITQAVETIIAVAKHGNRGDVFVPILPAATIGQIAKAVIGGRNIETKEVGLRAGERIHEPMVSEEEVFRTERVTTRDGEYFAIRPTLKELRSDIINPALDKPYVSDGSVVSQEEVNKLLEKAETFSS